MLNKSATVSSVTNLDRGFTTEVDLWIIFDSPIAEELDWFSDIMVVHWSIVSVQDRDHLSRLSLIGRQESVFETSRRSAVLDAMIINARE